MCVGIPEYRPNWSVTRHVGFRPLGNHPLCNRPHEGFEPLTQDSMSNPLTNCTILGHTGKGVIGLFEEAGDGIGRHVWLIDVKNNYSQARGVFFQTRDPGQVP
jgi:hypothetical protein